MRFSHAFVGAALVLRAALCHAADPEAPVSPPTDAGADQAPTFHSRTSFDVGAAYFGGGGADRLGVAIESNSVFPIAGRWGVGLRFAWGMTEFQRFKPWTHTGYTIGKWTTTAYGDVARWSVRGGKYELFTLFGSIIAYVGLLVPLMISGLCYMAAVIAPTTFLETALTANYDLGDGRIGPFVEAGLGVVAFVHPTLGKLRGGLGPAIGSGLRFGPARLGAHLTWSPPHLHGEPGGGLSSVFVGGFTVGIASR
jgi:hypothetical protein